MNQINYTFPADCKIEKLRNVTVTGGNIGRQRVNGTFVAVVNFTTSPVGPLTVVVAGKPELEATIAAACAAEENAIANTQNALEAAIPGLATMLELERTVLADVEQAAESFNFVMSSGSGHAPYHADEKLAETLTAMKSANPRAALYCEAAAINHNTSWADNTGKGASAKRAMEILATGGSIEDATAAMNARREYTD